MKKQSKNYKWYILLLVVFTEMFVVAIPSMGMSVLAKEISLDLNLDLVQVGVIWGIGSLLGIPASLLGGGIGDRIGPKGVLTAGTLLASLLGLARGLADSFTSMVVIVILLGAVIPFVLMNAIKTVGQWFASHELGRANGISAMGMALGFMIGSLLSATTFSPLLGGWRNVMIAYGVIGALISIPWFFTRPAPQPGRSAGVPISIWKSFQHAAGLKNIWLLGLTLLGINGAITGTLGYLPLYLRGAGWQPIQADGALTAFHLVSMALVLPIALLSDRLGARKRLLLITGLMIAFGVGWLSFAGGGAVWAAVLLAGCVRDGFMAIFLTMVIETEGVGPAFAGTATGLTMAISGFGNLISPPIGNSLAGLWSGAPFAFWSMLGLLGVVCVLFLKDGKRAVPGAQV